MTMNGEVVDTVVLGAKENEIEEITESPSEDRELALRSLRGRWELASVLNFFQVFESLIGMERKFSAEDIESALIEPNDFLAEIHKTLLKGIPPVNKKMNDHDAWITVLCKKMATWWSWVAEGDIPLTVDKGEEVLKYKKLDPTVRLQILKALCELRADQHDVVDYINDAVKNGTEVSHFRKNEIGEENGTTYWYDGNGQIGYRLYKEVINSEVINSAVPPVPLWETLATNLEEFRKIINDSSYSQSKVGMAVVKTIEAEIVPVLEKLEKKKERAARKQQHGSDKQLENLLCKEFQSTRITRSSRSSKPVSYTFDDYDKAINEAIQATNKRQAYTKNQKLNKKIKSNSNEESDLENSGLDLDNAKEENCKDFSGDEKNNGNCQKQTSNNVVAKRLQINAALENVADPDSEDVSQSQDKSS